MAFASQPRLNEEQYSPIGSSRVATEGEGAAIFSLAWDDSEFGFARAVFLSVCLLCSGIDYFLMCEDLLLRPVAVFCWFRSGSGLATLRSRSKVR